MVKFLQKLGIIQIVGCDVYNMNNREKYEYWLEAAQYDL